MPKMESGQRTVLTEPPQETTGEIDIRYRREVWCGNRIDRRVRSSFCSYPGAFRHALNPGE